LHPPQKLQHPEILPVYVACPRADADNFSSPTDKKFLYGELSYEKKDTCDLASIFFFFARKLAKQKVVAIG
jgi:hypothetical protein